MPDWACARSGDCCTSPVGMTVAEWRVVSAAAPDVPVWLRALPDGRVEVSAREGERCAFYRDGCTVYAVRPGVCRAFGCFRKEGEPFVEGGNLVRIAESAGVRRVQARMVVEAEQWTEACGD